MKTNTLSSVEPVDPPAPWMGGKRKLAKQICALIETFEHRTYGEPFFGMGGVFFSRERRPKVEAINDINRDVINLFRVLQRHYNPFVDMLRWQMKSRDEFERLRTVDPESLTDLERAARFLYLQKLAYGGRVRGQTYGVSPNSPRPFASHEVQSNLENIHARLEAVTIERLDWREFIKRYDGPEMLFYLDPPYVGVEGYYGPGIFDPLDFEEMASVLAAIKGRFVMSLNDTDKSRAIFSRFAMRSMSVTYSIAKGKRKQTAELLISSKA